MHAHIASIAHTHSASTAEPAGFRARLAMITGVLQRLPLPLIQLLFRLAIAAVFLKAGLTKTANWMLTVQLFADEYQVPVLSPEIAAMMSVTFEFGCSILLVLGLATRLATLPLLGCWPSSSRLCLPTPVPT